MSPARRSEQTLPIKPPATIAGQSPRRLNKTEPSITPLVGQIVMRPGDMGRPTARSLVNGPSKAVEYYMKA